MEMTDFLTENSLMENRGNGTAFLRAEEEKSC